MRAQLPGTAQGEFFRDETGPWGSGDKGALIPVSARPGNTCSVGEEHGEASCPPPPTPGAPSAPWQMAVPGEGLENPALGPVASRNVSG